MLNPAHGRLTLVGVSLGVVHGLILLVDSRVFGCTCAGPEACVGVLGDILVCLLGAFVGSALNGLGDVVCGVLKIQVRGIQSIRFKWSSANLGGFHCEYRYVLIM